MAPILRIVKLALAAFGGLIYVWFAGVRNAPAAKRRKRRRRRVRADATSRTPGRAPR